MKDKSKSILVKLKNRRKKTGISFQQLLLLLCQEEFLRRLSKTKISDNFILKGGLFIYILSDFESRGTVNIDIGVGDVIVPKSKVRIMKSQLEECGTVNVNTYSLESSMAEKIDAILQRYELTSRMKDFYDVW